jgi:hypothetical protein
MRLPTKYYKTGKVGKGGTGGGSRKREGADTMQNDLISKHKILICGYR